jgi:hypothetical protein
MCFIRVTMREVACKEAFTLSDSLDSPTSGLENISSGMMQVRACPETGAGTCSEPVFCIDKGSLDSPQTLQGCNLGHSPL